MTKQTKIDDLTWEEVDDLFKGVPPVEVVAKAMRESYIDLDRDPEFVAGYLKAQFVEDIYKAMEEQGLNRSQLANKLGKTRQYVGRVLNENANFTLETLAEIACALGMQVSARMYSREERFMILPAVTRPQEVLPFTGTLDFVKEKKQPVYAAEQHHAGYIAA